MGRVIAKWPRESFYLATKMPLWQCGSLEEAQHIFEEQLRRLGVEYIDFYLLHSLHAAANYKSDETGFCLGDWLRRMREWDTTHDPKLTPERRAMLDKIGMEWSE